MRFPQVTSFFLCCLSSAGLSIGASACFVDSRPDPDAREDSGTTGDGSTGAGPASGISASATTPQSSTETSPTQPVTTAPVTTEPTSPDPTSGTTDTTGGAQDTTSGSDETGGTSTGAPALGVDELEIGDLIITEVMNNPTCDGDSCEWIELYNATALPIDLQGLRVGDRQDATRKTPDGLITVSLIIPAGGLAVLVRQAEGWPYAVDYDAEYGTNVAFTNGSPETAAIFNTDNQILDETALFFGQAPDSGRSFILDPNFWDADANNNSDNWCLSDTPLESSGIPDEWGTPASAEVLCATPPE